MVGQTGLTYRHRKKMLTEGRDYLYVMMGWTWDQEQPMVVTGFFGAGKTNAILMAAWYADIKKASDKVMIIAFPLRALRNDKYRQLVEWGAESFVFKAHDEVCLDLKECLARVKREKGGVSRADYYKCLTEHLKNGNCVYRQHVEEMKQYVRKGGRVIITTHVLARIPKLMFPNSRLIVDEAEDYLIKLSEPIPRWEVDAVADEKVKAIFERYFMVVKDSKGREYYVIKPEGLKVLFARDATYVSATFPPSLLELLPQIGSLISYGKRKRRQLATFADVNVKELRSRTDNDVAIVLRRRLIWRRRQEWSPAVTSTVIKIVNLAIRRYGVVGIVSRRKEMTNDLADALRSAGFTVWADTQYNPYKSRDVYTRAQVVIITTRGPFYRGRSVFSVPMIERCRRECEENCKKGNKQKCYEDCMDDCQKDFPVILAFYQARRDKLHPAIEDALVVIGGEDLYRRFRTELVHARNLQALYRFNRERGKQHIMLLFDERFEEAFKTYYPRRWSKRFKRLYADNIEDMYTISKAIA